MKKYQESLFDGKRLDSTIRLLENTSVLIDIFSNRNTCVDSVADPRIAKLLQVLDFFVKWESQFDDPKEKNKHLMSRD